MIYLATPYYHPEVAVREKRVESAAWITRSLLRRGLAVFSPIVHGGYVQSLADRPIMANEEWVTMDFQYILRSSMLMVAQIEGWQQSKGIEREVLFCKEHGIPASCINFEMCQMMIEAEKKVSG